MQQAGLTERYSGVKLMDALGRNVRHASWHTSDSDKIIVDLTSLPAGVYFVHVALRAGHGDIVHRILKT